MGAKDYYKILGVAPAANEQAIKKAYRKLAHQYHPDKNPGDNQAASQFREIAEAYAILGNATTRSVYDLEIWKFGYDSPYISVEQKATPQTILQYCTELNAALLKMDPNSISFLALKAYISMILNDEFMDLLISENDEYYNTRIVQELLVALNRLEPTDKKDIYDKLILLAGANQKLCQNISAAISAATRTQKMKQLQPYFIALITLLLCVLVFIFSRIK